MKPSVKRRSRRNSLGSEADDELDRPPVKQPRRSAQQLKCSAQPPPWTFTAPVDLEVGSSPRDPLDSSPVPTPTLAQPPRVSRSPPPRCAAVQGQLRVPAKRLPGRPKKVVKPATVGVYCELIWVERSPPSRKGLQPREEQKKSPLKGPFVITAGGPDLAAFEDFQAIVAKTIGLAPNAVEPQSFTWRATKSNRVVQQPLPLGDQAGLDAFHQRLPGLGGTDTVAVISLARPREVAEAEVRSAPICRTCLLICVQEKKRDEQPEKNLEKLLQSAVRFYSLSLCCSMLTTVRKMSTRGCSLGARSSLTTMPQDARDIAASMPMPVPSTTSAPTTS